MASKISKVFLSIAGIHHRQIQGRQEERLLVFALLGAALWQYFSALYDGQFLHEFLHLLLYVLGV